MLDLFDDIEEVKQEESIQENKQEVVQSDDIERMIEEQEEIAEVAEDPIQEVSQAEREKRKQRLQELADAITVNENSTQEVAQEESIQEDKQEYKEIEYNFKQYLKSIIAIQNLAIEESDDCLSFVFTIKKDDLMTFTPPKTYSSYEHSVKIKKGQEEAKKHGRKPGLKKGSKRERTDKQPLIEQIKKLSNSFNGAMNNHELAKALHCSLNRICNYKREIKKQLKNSN